MTPYFQNFKRTLGLLLIFGFAMLYSNLQAQAVTASNDKSNYIVKTDNENLQIEHDGKITIGPDDRSISNISDNGYIRIQKTIAGNTCEILVNKRDGSLHYEYKESGRNKPFDPAGKAWLTDMLPDLMCSTTIGAKSRADRLYDQGGVPGVLSELPNLKSDHLKAHYVQLLFSKDIKSAEIPQLISAVGRHLSSDRYRYEVFKLNSELLLSDPKNTSNYLEAIKTI